MYYVHSPVRTRCRWLFEKYKSLLGAGATEKQIHYAAFLATMDAYIGQLLQALESTGQSENTLVIFLSDNGGHPGFRGNAPRSEERRVGKECVRTCRLWGWPDHKKT